MGAIFSNIDPSNVITPNNTKEDSVAIKFSRSDFGTFHGQADKCITFKENILSKDGVGSYSMYLKKEFLLESRYKEGNQRIYYLLQSATNGGGAAHIVR
jgi:hypothetical protein